MIDYALQDADGNNFLLNGVTKPRLESSTLSYLSENFSFDNRIVSNSFLPGAVQIGDSRLMDRNITFELIRGRGEQNESAFRQSINELIQALNTTKYLIDVTNDKRISATASEVNISFRKGTEYKLSEETFSLTFLNPFWEDETEQTQSTTTVAATQKAVSFANSGYSEVSVKFEITVAALCSSVEIISGQDIIRVEDTIFGSTNNLVMTIDNISGIVTVGFFDRTKSIVPGLGFIQIPTGTADLLLKTTVPATVNMTWRRRYYV